MLRTIIGMLSDEEATWNPAPQRFSIAEIMAHLCGVETQVFRARLARMVNEDCPQLDAYDQKAMGAAGGYAGCCTVLFSKTSTMLARSPS